MIKTPVNQVRLTNVALVKLKRRNIKFELACYRNKIQDYRNQKETDLGEVLQQEEIYTNVSKGEVANKKSLQTAFPGMSKDDIIIQILTKGELQVSDLERSEEQDRVKTIVANMVAQMCFNNQNNTLFPTSIILKAMGDLQFNLKPGQSSKKQALELMKDLPSVLPMERMKIELLVQTDPFDQEVFLKAASEAFELGVEFKVRSQDQGRLVLLIEPHLYRGLSDLSGDKNQKWRPGSVSVQILQQTIVEPIVAKKVEEPINKEEVKVEEVKKEEDEKSEAAFQCIQCVGSGFDTREEYKDHFKSEWHVQNVTRSMSNLRLFSEHEFQCYKETVLDSKTEKQIKKGNNKRKKRGKDDDDEDW